jgi:hypothetical protein
MSSQAAISVEDSERTSPRRVPARSALVDRLVADLAFGRIHSVAFVVGSDASWTVPLYDVAIDTARRGWRLGLDDVRYWFVTPEPEPLARLGPAVSGVASQRLEPEGITFIGSTYPDIRPGLVLLDPQGESIEADVIVSLGHSRRPWAMMLRHGAVARDGEHARHADRTARAVRRGGRACASGAHR